MKLVFFFLITAFAMEVLGFMSRYHATHIVEIFHIFQLYFVYLYFVLCIVAL